MGTYSQAFEEAVDHAMLYEVGGWWNINEKGAKDGTIPHACGYINDPSDPGGETKYGIAKNANPNIDILHLDWEGAKSIYYSHYWLNAKCNKMDERIAALNFDGAIQHGVETAAKFIQRAIGVDDDGAIGPVTLATLAKKDAITVCNSVCDQRNTYYNNIVAKTPSQQKYLAGWMRRVAEMRAFVTDPAHQF